MERPADDRDAEPAGAARKALAVVDISPPGTTQLDEGLEVALAMRNVHLTRDPDAPRAGVLLVVGADIARAEAWLGSARPEPVIVCTTDPSIDTLRRLIAAGASEVQPGPFRLEPLIKRILRATRGACP